MIYWPIVSSVASVRLGSCPRRRRKNGEVWDILSVSDAKVVCGGSGSGAFVGNAPENVAKKESVSALKGMIVAAAQASPSLAS